MRMAGLGRSIIYLAQLAEQGRAVQGRRRRWRAANTGEAAGT